MYRVDIQHLHLDVKMIGKKNLGGLNVKVGLLIHPTSNSSYQIGVSVYYTNVLITKTN